MNSFEAQLAFTKMISISSAKKALHQYINSHGLIRLIHRENFHFYRNSGKNRQMFAKEKNKDE